MQSIRGVKILFKPVIFLNELHASVNTWQPLIWFGLPAAFHIDRTRPLGLIAFLDEIIIKNSKKKFHDNIPPLIRMKVDGTLDYSITDSK
jgi:hypothetical protein